MKLKAGFDKVDFLEKRIYYTDLIHPADYEKSSH
jgi:hypothetical protein